MKTEALYALHRPRLRAAAAFAARRYGRRFDDCESDAALLFTLAVKRYTGSRPFSKDLNLWLRRIGNFAREDVRRDKLLTRRPRFVLSGVAAPADPELSPDAEEAMRLALQSRPGLWPRQVRRMLREYLTAAWGPARAEAAFTELKEVFG